MKNVAITVSEAPNLWQTPDWQQLWLATRAADTSWRSLALVPAGPGTSSQMLVQIAVALAHTGMVHTGAPIHVADGTRITLDQHVPFSEGLRWYMHKSEMMVLALSALADNVISLSLAKSADRALLCVVPGHTSIADAKQTIAQVGASKFVGSALFRLPLR